MRSLRHRRRARLRRAARVLLATVVLGLAVAGERATVPGATALAAGPAVAAASDAAASPGSWRRLHRRQHRRHRPAATTTTTTSTTTSTTVTTTAPPTTEPPAGNPPSALGCPMFPADNVWNAPVSGLPVHSRSATYLQSIGTASPLRVDVGGIPYNVVGAGQAKVPVRFDYADESDPGPYPIPANPAVEGGGDSHILMLDKDACRLYELYAAQRSGAAWTAGSGAIWDLRSDRLRPDGWTSTDAAGLPILPGLLRYDEIASGHIDHALRVTVPSTQAAHLWPARHDAGHADASLPPMGLRLRLKAGVDLAGFPPQARVVLQALKRYGAFVADNGHFFITAAPDPRLDVDQLAAMRSLTVADFEAVDESSLEADPDSGAVR